MSDYKSVDYFKMFQRYEILRSLSPSEFVKVVKEALYESNNEVSYNEAFDAIVDDMVKDFAKANDKRDKVLLNIKNGVVINKENLKAGSRHD